jgi:hypothetical protein
MTYDVHVRHAVNHQSIALRAELERAQRIAARFVVAMV